MDLRNHELSLSKQRRKTNFIVLAMGAALEANKHGRMINHSMPFVDIDVHLSQKKVCSLYDFKTLKSSSTWFIPASLCEGQFFYFYVESVFLLLSDSEANTCVNFVCNNFYMLVYCTYYIALCWQYPWDIYVESWKPVLKLKSSYVLIDAFYLESINYELTLVQNFFMHVLKVLFMKSFCLYDSVVYSLAIC